MSKDKLSYEGIAEDVVLHGLYHGTQAIGMGRLHNNPSFSLNAARRALSETFIKDGICYFDYVSGRPIKVHLDTNTKTIYRVSLYDRDAGEGACQRVIERLRGQR